MSRISRANARGDEPLILVDEENRVLGHSPRSECHRGDGLLHRAFSVMLFDPAGRLLLQQRSRHKELWPLYWSNSCCSHPRPGESLATAAESRLVEELGVRAELQLLYRFTYHARFGDVGSERELCAVLVGSSEQPIDADPDEVAAWRWIEPAELDQEMAEHPEAFTPWFLLEWARLRVDFNDIIESFRS
jgi:isopentenyl-diphosphate delta-isomerase